MNLSDMSPSQIDELIRRQAIVEYIGDGDGDWYTLSCLSDDGTTAYLKPRGTGLFRHSEVIGRLKAREAVRW